MDDADYVELNSSRRTVLGSAAAGITGLFAGCGGFSEFAQNREGPDTDGTESASTIDPSEYEGTTLEWYLVEDWFGPERAARWATWYGTGAFPGIGIPTSGYTRPGAAWDATMAPELWGAWVNRDIQSGDVHYGLYEDVELSPDELTIRIREDAAWSNGDPVLGRDAVPVTLAARLATGAPFETVATDGPISPVEAITDVEFDGKVARFLSDEDWFDEFVEQDLWAMVTRGTTDGGRGGVWQHTRVEPYEAWFDRLIDIWRQTTAGELDPWQSEFDLVDELTTAMPPPPESEDPPVGGGDSWAAYFHDPDHCLVTGAFEPVRVEPTLIVLDRNPEFYAAADVEIDRILLPLLDDLDQHWAALVAEQRDYLRGRVSAGQVESAPEEIEQRLVPSADGLALGWNHWTSPFDSPAVRQAIAYALDTARIATNDHPMRYEPITVPGGDTFRVRELLGEAFVEETLTTYERDPEAAAERMRAAGYTREDGAWVDGGTPIEFPVMARDPNSVVAHSVSSQLEEFGLEPQQVEFGSAPSGERSAAWPTQFGMGFALRAVGELYAALVEDEARAHRFGIVPREQISAASYGEQLLPSGELDAFTIEAPPVGEPDAPPESWHAPRLAWECVHAGSHAEYVETLRQLAWLVNWHLPVLPIARGYSQHFFDVENWAWPDLGVETYDGVGVDQLQPEDMVALGKVQPA